MRNLDECTAEVFRRSEERIKKRKKTRIRVLACCIPMCLMVAAVLAIPRGLSSEMAMPEVAPEDYQLQDTIVLGSSAGQSLRVCAGNSQLIMTGNPEVVTNAAEMLRSFFTGTDFETETSRMEDDQVYGMAPSESYGNKVYEATVTYTVSLTGEDGKVITYTVSGNVLRDVETGTEVIISDAQLAELLKLLQLV